MTINLAGIAVPENDGTITPGSGTTSITVPRNSAGILPLNITVSRMGEGRTVIPVLLSFAVKKEGGTPIRVRRPLDLRVIP